MKICCRNKKEYRKIINPYVKPNPFGLKKKKRYWKPLPRAEDLI